MFVGTSKTTVVKKFVGLKKILFVRSQFFVTLAYKTDKAMMYSQLQDHTESILNVPIITTFNPDKDKSTSPKGIVS